MLQVSILDRSNWYFSSPESPDIFFNVYQKSFRVKQLAREVDHSASSSAEVESDRS
jgi:hypothetical protein